MIAGAAIPQFSVWVVMMAPAYAQIIFGPLAVFRRTRPIAWWLMLLMHLPLRRIFEYGGLSVETFVIHLFAFDPGWIRGRRSREPDLVEYDGGCGFCHRSVRFLVYQDIEGDLFRFQPGPEGASSIIVNGNLTKSRAVLYLGERLGGFWRLLAVLLRLIPRFVADAAYNRFAKIRRRIYPAPDALCPVLPPHLRNRFLDKPR